MRHAIEKASVLIEALPFIQKFRNEIVVIKFGGSIMDDEEAVTNIMKDIGFVACVGMRPVVVHGGGKDITRRLHERGINSVFLDGLRVTDAESIHIVENVLNNEVNPKLVKMLSAIDCKARGIHGDDIFQVVRMTRVDPKTSITKEWGFVGDVTNVDITPVEALIKTGIIPVITPLGRDAKRQIHNINADDAAAAISKAVHAKKLIFLSDVPGVLSDPDDPDSILSTIHVREVDELIQRGAIKGGMLPKIGGAVATLKSGVRKAHIIDGTMPHSLLLELFTEKGIGTEIIS